MARLYVTVSVHQDALRMRRLRPDSDLDVIIEADKPYRFDLLGLIALEQEISEDLGINVDLMLAEDLKPSVARRADIEAVSV